MKTKLFIITLLSSILFSCATTGVTTTGVTTIEDMGSSIGVAQPEWMQYITSVSKMEALYPKKVPFTYNETGTDLNYLKRKINSTTLSAEYSRTLTQAVLQSASEESGQDFTEHEQSIQQASSSTFSGFRKEGEWWQLKRYPNGDEKYTYYVLYLVDEDNFDRALSSVIKKSSGTIGEEIANKLEKNIENVKNIYMNAQQ